jgi:hypothetical protein
VTAAAAVERKRRRRALTGTEVEKRTEGSEGRMSEKGRRQGGRGKACTCF